MAETVIDFIRHGEPVGGRRFRGSGVDDPLSEGGMQQMWQAIGVHCPWQRIVSSPMQRCAGFADALAERHRLPLRLDDRLKEVGFGAWEGQTPEQLRRNDPDGYRAFYRAPLDWRPTGAEPFADFVQRVAAAYDEIVETGDGEQVLVVTHAGVIRAVFAHVFAIDLNRAYNLRVDNAGMTRLTHGEHGSVLVFHNSRLALHT